MSRPRRGGGQRVSRPHHAAGSVTRAQQTRPRDARALALEVLRRVRVDGAFANLLVPQLLGESALSAADRALATELAYGTLRLAGRYDCLIELAAARTRGRIDPLVLDALRLGAHQLLALHTPAHAAINETVELVRRGVGQRAVGFANAVLRRIGERDLDAWLAVLDADPSQRDAARVVRFAHPAWMLDALDDSLRAHGRGGELAALASADNAAPKVTLVDLPGRGDAEAGTARAGHEDAPSRPHRRPVSPLARELDGGDPASDAGVRAGSSRVQDAGSQLAALCLSRVRPVTGPERWLDLCAGPGGKAVLLAAEAARSGASLSCNEVAPHRAELVRQALATAGFEGVEVSVADGRELEAPDGGFERIMLDAPCSGLGALRRRPEARWRKTAEEVVELAELQAQLLRHAAGLLAPGGIVAYVTCSPHLAETVEVVEAVLGERADLRLLDTAGLAREISGSELGGQPDARPAIARTVQLWPDRDGCDAMFVALLERDVEGASAVDPQPGDARPAHGGQRR